MVTLVLNLLMGLLGAVAIRSWKRGGLPRQETRRRLGLDPSRLAPELGAGALIGALAIASVYVAERTGGHAELGGGALGALARADVWLMLSAGAIGEELVFRSFGLNGVIHLTRRPGVAVAVTAAAFGLAHATAPNATALSVVSTALGGVMYAVAFLRTGRLWAPIGLHLAWNATQALVFGFPMSGRSFESALGVQVEGPEWWTGGDYGPEGGVVGLCARILVIALLLLVLRLDRSEESSDEGTATVAD